MKHLKKLLALLLALTLVCGLLPGAFAAAPAEPAEPNAWEVPINAAYFPDAFFRSYVSSKFDTNGNGSLSAPELAAVTTMVCGKMNISNLKGVEYFTALTELACFDNQLTSLDVSKNTALTELYCFGNQLTSLDLGKNTALTELDCFNNQLTSLDVSKNTALTELDCSYNQLTSLNLGENAALRQLYCYNNHLTSLDVSRVPFLKDAVENGTKDSPDSKCDCYYSSQGTLYVDNTVTIITDHSPDLGGYTFDFRSGPVEHPGFAIGLELAVMGNQGDIGMSSGGGYVSLLDLDLDGHDDVRIYYKNGTGYFYVDSHTNLRGTYTVTVSEAVKNAFASSGLDYYSSFTFQYPSPWNPFTDVKEGKDYYDAILWAYYHDPQVTAGVTATTFGVGKAVKRGDAMFYLWVAAGKPEPTLTKSPFTDVTDPKAYYYKAILWAYENGITKGVSATEFGRKKTVSRRDMLVFLYKQQGSPAPTLTQSPYSDVTDPKAYYYKAVLWAYEKGIERGSGGKFNGKTNCLRETVVLWMYRVLAE